MAIGPRMRMRNRIFRVYVHTGYYNNTLRDRRTIYIQFAHSCTVYVGLAQARPNYVGDIIQCKGALLH